MGTDRKKGETTARGELAPEAREDERVLRLSAEVKGAGAGEG